MSFSCLHPVVCGQKGCTWHKRFSCVCFFCVFLTFLTYMLVQSSFNLWNLPQLSSKCSAFGEQWQHDVTTAKKTAEELLSSMKAGSETCWCLFPAGHRDTVAECAHVRLHNSIIKFFCGSSLRVGDFKESKLTMWVGTILTSGKEPLSCIQLIATKPNPTS